MDLVTRKAVYRAEQDYDIALKRIREDYERNIYRAAVDGLDQIYLRFRWNHDKFMDIRQTILDEINLLLKKEWRHPSLLKLQENNFDLLAWRYFRGRIYLSDLLHEADSLREWNYSVASRELRQYMIFPYDEHSKQDHTDGIEEAGRCKLQKICDE